MTGAAITGAAFITGAAATTGTAPWETCIKNYFLRFFTLPNKSSTNVHITYEYTVFKKVGTYQNVTLVRCGNWYSSFNNWSGYNWGMVSYRATVNTTVGKTNGTEQHSNL